MHKDLNQVIKHLGELGWTALTNSRGNIRMTPPFKGSSLTIVPHHHNGGPKVKMMYQDIRRIYRSAGKVPPL